MKGEEVQAWLDKMEALLQPEKVVWIHGGEKEHQAVLQTLVKQGVAIPLNETLRPNSYLFRSDPRDVARVESRTYICSETKEEAGPTNHWMAPDEMRQQLKPLFEGAMKGRTLYVIPFAMGPLSSPFVKCGIQLTDSLYVVANMALMTEMGTQVLKKIEETSFVPCVHSVGATDSRSKWPCDPEHLTVAHFPKEREIWSYGSGYGGNALLGKKCLALRIASVLARDEGWLAEHMLIIGITNPEGKKRYFLGSFPSACGKTNLALLTPDLPGWKVETVGDDIAWIRPGPDGRLYAVNPEAGFFGVAPGTSWQSNPKAMETITRDTLFTNVALTADYDVWWEGMGTTPAKPVINWLGEEWDGQSKAAQSNSRFTVSIRRCPSRDPAWNRAEGVPISGILFGGRRSSLIPLVMESHDWTEGVLYGASVSSERTAAAEGTVGQLRHDPFSMLPFCGYDMGDYFAHWLTFSKLEKLPNIYFVNWFQKDEGGEYLWPGFGANTRVMKWIFERCEGKHTGTDTIVGLFPKKEEIDLQGLSLKDGAIDQLLSYDGKDWKEESARLQTYFALFGSTFPNALKEKLATWAKQ